MPQYPPKGDPRSDAELISAVRSGDPKAYGELFARHSAAVTAMARYYARDNFTADDLTSDAFERTMNVIRGGGGPDVSFRAYIYTSVRRLAYEQTEKGRRTYVTDDFTEFEMPDEVDDPAVTNFERTLVTGAFAGLPERWQAVLWYIEVEGMSPPEIAPLLGLSANGVSALAYRAREGLREAYLQSHVMAEPAREACEEFRGKLGAYVRGGLSKRDEGKVEAHLDTCEECSAIVAELRDVGHGMRAIIAPLVLGGAATAGLGLGSTGTGASVAAVLASRGLSRGSRLVAGAAAAAAMAAIATMIIVAAFPGEEPGAVSSASEPSGQPTTSASAAPSPGRTTLPTPTPSAPPTSAVPRAAPPQHPVPSPSPVAPSPTPTSPPPTSPAPQPRLTLAMADVGDLVLGRDGMVGVTVSNTGKGAAASLSVTISLPTGVAIDPSRAMTTEGASGWSCTPVASRIVCSGAALAVGAAMNVYLPVTVSPSADTSAPAGATMSAAGQPSQTVRAAVPVVAQGVGTRFLVNGQYASTVVGASFVGCDVTVANCLLARDRQPGVPLDNNDWNMVALDEAGTGSVSSSSTLGMPAGASVAFAGLYWSGQVPLGADAVSLGRLQLTAPGGAASSIVASRVDFALVGPNEAYQSFADVTSVVAAAGGGAWTASGALLGPAAAAAPGGALGADSYGGWSLVVVYENAALTPGRVTVFDGFEPVTSSDVSFVVAGIAGTSVTVDILAWEGDAGTPGDSLALDGGALTRTSGGLAADNAFDSSADGAATANSFGVDAGAFLPTPLNQARAVLTASTSGDYYLVGVVTTTTR